MSQIFLNSGTLVILCPFCNHGLSILELDIVRYVHLLFCKCVQCEQAEMIVDKNFPAFQRAGL